MSDANLYQILGVSRSASAEEIKSAYRELVKRYHPDLFTTAVEKTEPTEKLRRINEAYEVLGNAKRRQRYDQEFIQRPKTRARAPSAWRRPARARGHINPRSQAAEALKDRRHFPKRQVGYSLAAATVVLVLVYAGLSEPRLASAWTLWEKLEFSPAGISSPEGGRQDWVSLGQYAAASECARRLKDRVRADERGGSRAIFDERNGTMAITVYIKKEAAPDRDDGKSDWNPEGSSGSQASAESFSASVTKRVRNLECRQTQRLESESWIRRTLRKVGLVFSAQ